VYTDIYTHRNEYGILFTQTLPATLTGEVENKMLAINVNYPEPYPFTRLPARRLKKFISLKFSVHSFQFMVNRYCLPLQG
jgi:hypothetical protein